MSRFAGGLKALWSRSRVNLQRWSSETPDEHRQYTLRSLVQALEGSAVAAVATEQGGLPSFLIDLLDGDRRDAVVDLLLEEGLIDHLSVGEREALPISDLVREAANQLDQRHAAALAAFLVAEEGKRLSKIRDSARAIDSRDLGTRTTEVLRPEDIAFAAPAAEETIEHTLARLFLRIGPPPEPTEFDYEPVGSGGGGAQQ